ncbi:MAG: aminopeptidase P family protein [Alphaproteobacteria bacterium]|nr:aminopeptidase P family protein [Alphaproteobacteria bacterium]
MQAREKLAAVRKAFINHAIAGYLQPVHDEYMSEYPPAAFQRVAWLSGFSGSAGMAVVLADKAALFVDGRYTLQAASEIDASCFSIYNSAEVTAEAWLAGELQGAMIGYDPALFTKAMLERMQARCDKSGVALVACPNLVDAVWADQPAPPATPVFLHDDALAGESAASKCERLGKRITEQGVDAAFISAPESVCWLLNIRARDVECTPLALVRAVLHGDGHVDLFIDPKRLPPLPEHITAIHPPSLARLNGKAVLCDATQMPVALLDELKSAGARIVKGEDPCVLPKACKNPVQLAGIRAAHRRDGVAVSKLLKWIDAHPDIHSVSEMDIDRQLLSFRKEQNMFIEPSFPTIAGSGANGAIVHYRANEKTNRNLKSGELLLLDSGGQYEDGTTDITRTIAIGTPTAEHKDRFTRVLKGHIALATVQFPKGTRGSQLDSLARQYLWQVGLDYDHGTGHGVGQFLGVHEGPQRISKRGGDAALEIGMILSNEPGYYKVGAYGIRIENLVEVVEKGEGFLGFETITCVPIDTKLVDFSLLSSEEKHWLEEYNARASLL